MNRRSFMTLLAMSPLAGCASVNQPIERKNLDKKVIVIGAGLSGLVSAVRLLEQGVKVTLIDSEPRVGGRIYLNPSEEHKLTLVRSMCLKVIMNT